MPPPGLTIGGVEFTDLAVTLKTATSGAAAVTLKYRAFIQTVIDFPIVAFAIFLVIKMKTKSEAPSKEVILLTSIRDTVNK